MKMSDMNLIFFVIGVVVFLLFLVAVAIPPLLEIGWWLAKKVENFLRGK